MSPPAHRPTRELRLVQLLGRLIGIERHRAHFADDLPDSVAFGDARYADIPNGRAVWL
ncbi:MAG: hypothetical protein WCG47_28370 [Dermatophilaceae bacterium]